MQRKFASSLVPLALLIALLVACGPDGGMSSGGTGGTDGAGAAASGGAASGAGGQASGSGGVVASGGVSAAASGGGSSGGAAAGGTNASGGASTGGAPNSGGGGALATGGAGRSDVTLYIAGDSTVSNYADTASATDQAGWGQMLSAIFSDQVTVDNRAAGGRTALWFQLEGAAPGIIEDLEPGDYFFIQFGTNDGNTTATFTVDGVTYPRYSDPQTDFKADLKDYYLDPTRAVSAIPVLVTPPPRNSAYCGNGNSLGAYAAAMRELGEAEDVAVLDLNQKTFDHLAAICPAPTPEDFFFIRADATVDGTHFQENGARHMASFLGVCLQDIDLGLASYLLP